MNILEIKEIEAGYGARQVLFGIDLSIEKGQRVLLMGPNGSGKSTLLRVIIGILKPYRGTVYFDGKDISKLSAEKRVRMGISYLRQYKNIFPGLTVQENLILAGYYLDQQKLKEKIDWVLSIFPFLKDKLDGRAGLLSGGERQALAVSMVLIQDAELLLLDEPTAGLAPKAAEEILNSIKSAQEQLNNTILIVEHNLKLVSGWVTRVLGMAQGKIALDYTDIDMLIKNKGELEKLYFGAT
ncbi:MAG TPA: ABC transporter ATP-binding protein [Deltaproteobacteria bacterium]|nr:ABC transporter ATP-binding protein [Deltaproteobacteria bacterium]